MLILALTLLTPACGSRRPVQVIQEEPPFSSVVAAADSSVARQFVRGFHSVEQGAWRWSMGEFSVMLQPPPAAARNGATLELTLTIPDNIIERKGPVTLSAAIEGRRLEPEVYAKPGDYVYRREAPAAALADSPVIASFTVDKYFRSGELESRELGIVFKSAALVARVAPPEPAGRSRIRAGASGR